MNFKKITLSLLCGGVAAAAIAQPYYGRVFTFDNNVATNGTATYVLNGDGAGAYLFSGAVSGAGNTNGIEGASTTNVGFLVSTIVNVNSYVYISGNFGAVYTVQGIGAASDISQTENIEVRTNRSLTFTASGFYGLGPTVGTIAYTMSLFQDYPLNGVVLAGTGFPLFDNYFNGATLNLNAITQLPPDGRLTLQLARTLTLYQAAQGGHTYSAAGTIQVAVN